MSLQMRLRRNKRRQMLKRRRRFFGTLISLVLVICTVMAMIGIPSTSANDGDYITVTVSSGDSLWSIVSNIYPDENIRKIVDEIKEINNLDSSRISVGETLMIPSK